MVLFVLDQRRPAATLYRRAQANFKLLNYELAHEAHAPGGDSKASSRASLHRRLPFLIKCPKVLERLPAVIPPLVGSSHRGKDVRGEEEVVKGPGRGKFSCVCTCIFPCGRLSGAPV